MIRRSFLAATGIATLSFASSPKSIADESSLAALRKAGIVRMGFSNEAPFSYTLPDGKLAGIDYEVMRHVFASLGITRIDGVLTPFASLIPALQAARFDAIATGLYIRPDRCKQVLFSEPTLVVRAAVIVPTGNPKRIHSFQDIAGNPAFRLGYVLGGTTAVPLAGGVAQGQLVGFTDVATAVSALKTGRVDGLMRTSIDAERIVREDVGKTIEVAAPFQEPLKNGKPISDYIGFAFSSTAKDLVDAFNQQLSKFLGSAEHRSLLAKYHITEERYPIGETTASVCSG